MIWFNSANHDAEGFANPWRFDLAREKNDHMAFGRNGPHLCLGAPGWPAWRCAWCSKN